MRNSYVFIIKLIIFTFRIPKYCIVLSIEISHARRAWTIIAPNNLISKVLLTEYLVHKNLYIMSYVIVEMYIYACGIAHYRLDSHEVLVHPVEVVLLIPDVAIHLLLEFLHVTIVELLLCLVDSLLHERISAYINLLCVVGT